LIMHLITDEDLAIFPDAIPTGFASCQTIAQDCIEQGRKSRTTRRALTKSASNDSQSALVRHHARRRFLFLSGSPRMLQSVAVARQHLDELLHLPDQLQKAIARTTKSGLNGKKPSTMTASFPALSKPRGDVGAGYFFRPTAPPPIHTESIDPSDTRTIRVDVPSTHYNKRHII
jgi:hypothetical protein